MEKNDDKTANPRISFDISTSHWRWRQVDQSASSSSPPPRHLHSLVYHNNHLYVFGGFSDGEKHLDDFWQFSLAKRRWKKMKAKNQPSARHSHQAVIYQDKMILFGGISNGKTMNDLWSFDFASETWKHENNLEKSLWGHSMVTLYDKIVIFGGSDEDVKPTNTLIVLDASTLAPVPMNVDNVPPARQYASMVAYDGAIYLFGGFNKTSLQDFYKITLSAKDTNQIETESLEVPSFVQNLRGASLSVLPFHSQLILFGSRTDKQLSDVIYSFALGSSKWSTCESVGPSARYYHRTCTIDGRVIMHGGLGMKDGAAKASNLNDMWIYSDDVNIVAPRTEKFVFDPSYIPVEIWSLALSYLEASGESVSSASVVSKQFYNLIMIDERLKEQLKRYIQSKRIFLPPIVDETIKIAIIGAGGIGKSASTIQFIQSLFIDEYDPTIEDNYRKQINVDGRIVLLDLLDTAGPEEYSAMLEVWMKTGHGVYGVYSITNEHSLRELDYYMERSGKMKGGSFPAIIVGNKSDLEAERKVSQEQGQAMAKKYNAMWMETSAKHRINIEEAMFALTRSILAADKARSQKTTTAPPKKDRCNIS